MNVKKWLRGGRLPHLWRTGILALTLTAGVQAGSEPCGFFEIDGVPGYGNADLWFTADYWREAGTFPAVPDFNGDGQVNVLDLVAQSSCQPGLEHGLIASYYGFADGNPSQTITFPNFNALTQEPAVVRVAEVINEQEGWAGFLDSDFTKLFGAVFEGYLFVPEAATYTLTITGNRGMRLYFNGALQADFDGSPRQDSVTLALAYGLLPIRIEYYTSQQTPGATFSWSSNGSEIGPVSIPIDLAYLYHEGKVVPEYANSEPELWITPASGTRTTASTLEITAHGMSPNPQSRFYIDDQEQVTADGSLVKTLALTPGLNQFRFRIVDDQGRELEQEYYVYSAREAAPSSGLAANIYATELYEGVLATHHNVLAGLTPHHTLSHSGTQVVRVNNGTSIGGLVLDRGNVVQLQGILRITQAGSYNFRVTNGGLFLNGEFVAGIGVKFNQQWDPDNTVTLEAGDYHYTTYCYDAWSGPDMRVYWSLNGGTETTIPDSVFFHGPSHRIQNFASRARATGGRVSSGQLAEYLFKPNALTTDTSGNGFDLMPDPRAIQRSPGGVSFKTGGSLFSEQAGVHCAAAIQSAGTLSLEADFTYDADIQDWYTRDLVAVNESNWGSLARLAVQNDQVRFLIVDSNDVVNSLTADGAVVKGQRVHAVGTYDGATMRIYINGSLAATRVGVVTLTNWKNLAQVNVGQRFNRRIDQDTSPDTPLATIHVASIYNRSLSSAEIAQNRSANLTINPNPSALAAPTVVTFPLAGTSNSQLQQAAHYLNRLTFGANAPEINNMLTLGLDAWLTQQLNPAGIDDSAIEPYLESDIFRPNGYSNDFQALAMFRMAQSKRQLQEVMTQFWENHFNTQKDKVDHIAEEVAEHERFRELALGDFRSLLVASATHYPMTVYLDNISNKVGAPNENYAREVFELFGLGVNNGYTQADIVEAARCFTGWTVKNGRFYFNAGSHDYGAKTVLGQTIPAGGGFSDGMRVLEIVAESDECAEFITWKLCQLLIDDEPPADVWDAAKATFLANDGDIPQTLLSITGHNRFRTDTAYRKNKVKTPLEFLISVARAMEAYTPTTGLVFYTRFMGMDLFNYADPTGFEEAGVHWIDTNSLLTRWNMVNDFTTSRAASLNISIDFKTFLQKYGLTTSDQILDFFSNLTTQGSENAGVRAIAESWLTSGNPGSFTLNDTTIDQAVRQTFGLYLRLPEFNKQ